MPSPTRRIDCGASGSPPRSPTGSPWRSWSARGSSCSGRRSGTARREPSPASSSDHEVHAVAVRGVRRQLPGGAPGLLDGFERFQVGQQTVMLRLGHIGPDALERRIEEQRQRAEQPSKPGLMERMAEKAEATEARKKGQGPPPTGQGKGSAPRANQGKGARGKGGGNGRGTGSGNARAKGGGAGQAESGGRDGQGSGSPEQGRSDPAAWPTGPPNLRRAPNRGTSCGRRSRAVSRMSDRRDEPVDLEEQADAVADFVEELLVKMDIDAIAEPASVGERYYVDILDGSEDDMALLIGRHGQTLDAIQELARQVVGHRLDRADQGPRGRRGLPQAAGRQAGGAGRGGRGAGARDAARSRSSNRWTPSSGRSSTTPSPV